MEKIVQKIFLETRDKIWGKKNLFCMSFWRKKRRILIPLYWLWRRHRNIWKNVCSATDEKFYFKKHLFACTTLKKHIFVFWVHTPSCKIQVHVSDSKQKNCTQKQLFPIYERFVWVFFFFWSFHAILSWTFT